MSSLQRTQTSLSGFESGSKKKFGKNLNKLQKPAPPITNSGTNKSGSSKNGLLLLSTKRSSSSVGNLSSSGLLASKGTAAAAANKTVAPQMGGRSDFFTSTHEALLDAVSGATRKDREQQPDAWRSSEKLEDDCSAPTLPSEPDVVIITVNNPNDGSDSNHRHDQPRNDDDQRYNGGDGSSWRLQQNPLEPAESSGGDITPLLMSTFAREHAERIRNEEEIRMNEQRERASQRLRELEEKIALAGGKATFPQEPRQQIRSPILLAKLPSRIVDDTNSVQRHDNAKPRTLFDPTRTYSSLVGKVEPDTRQDDNKHTLFPVETVPHTPVEITMSCNARPDIPVIQLASYDDRDRGENRGKTAIPRMLFDPRSGSLVAVANDNAKMNKPQPKVHILRETLSSADSGEIAKLSKINGKGRKEEAPENRKVPRGRGNSVDSPTNELKNFKNRGAKIRPAEQRLPRTCGVLYVRDPKGNIYCVDGTDPEQYGSHFVRGGKIRNPAAHATFLDQQQHRESQNEADEEYETVTEFKGYNINSYGLNSNSTESAAVVPRKVELVKGNDKIELLTGAPESPTLKATAMEWAPSHTAMAAAAAAKGPMATQKVQSQTSIASVASCSIGFISDDDSEDADHTAFVGLGFDPTKNMDSVMASPTSQPRASTIFDIDGLTALSIDASNPSAPITATQNYFAFGLSGTWGSNGGAPLTGGIGNWDTALGAGNEKATTIAPSFIALSSNNTWGSGLSGYSGLSGGGKDD